MKHRPPKLLSLGLTAAALSAGQAVASDYIQLIDLPTLQAGGSGNLGSGVIVGTTGYAALNGATSRIVKIEDIGGANIVTTLVDTATLNSTFSDGSIGGGISGQLFAGGGSLYYLSPGEDEILKINPGATNSVSVLASESSINNFIGNSGPSVSFGGYNPATDTVFFYEGDIDSVVEVTSPNTYRIALNRPTLIDDTGDESPNGLAFDAAGIAYLGQTTSGLEGVSFIDPTDLSSGSLATEAEIIAVQDGNTDIGGSNTAFTVLSDGTLVFYDTTGDDFIGIDTVTGTPSVILSESQLLAGPASSDFAIAFTEFGGDLAWVQISAGGGGVPGFYAVPEPASALLIGGLVASGLVRRRRMA